MWRHLRAARSRVRIGITTVCRFVREAIEGLAVLARTLVEVMVTARTKAYVILDGTVLPIDRIADDTGPTTTARSGTMA